MSWSNSAIELIGYQDRKFDQSDVLHWQALRDCTARVRDFLRDLDTQLSAIETDKDLRPEGIARRRVDSARAALAKLDSFTALKVAEDKAGQRCESLQKKIDTLMAAGEPKTLAEGLLAQEIRAHVAKQNMPAIWVADRLNDPRIVAAVLDAPFLCGMSDNDVSVVRSKLLDSMDPHKEQQDISTARKVCREAVQSAKRMVAERASLRQDRDGEWRHQSAPTPTIAELRPIVPQPLKPLDRLKSNLDRSSEERAELRAIAAAPTGQ